MKTHFIKIIVVLFLVMNLFARKTASELKSETTWVLELVDGSSVFRLRLQSCLL